jgi:glycosyltransferase involved in cell wall biosynthesis
MVSRGVVAVGRKSGGAEFVAFQMARHLAQRGDDVVFIGDVDLAMFEGDSIAMTVERLRSDRGIAKQVRRIPFAFPRWLLQHLVGNLRAARRVHRLLGDASRPAFDVIHLHGALATVLVLLALRQKGHRIPLIYSEHDATPWTCPHRRLAERETRRAVYRMINLRACRSATTVVTNHHALAGELAQRSGLPPSRFAVVPNGFDDYRPSTQKVATSPKEAHGLDRYCLFVGALIDRKAPDLLIRALREVDIPCILVGGGPMRSELERLVQRFRLGDRVVFTGSIEPRDVTRYYEEADFLVLPSVSESAALVAIEALSFGTPVLSTHIPGVQSIVRDGENGLLVVPGSLASLVAGLSRLASDDALRELLARNAAATSSAAVIPWPAAVEQLHAVYRAHFEARVSPRLRDASAVIKTNLTVPSVETGSSFASPAQSSQPRRRAAGDLAAGDLAAGDRHA